jgi:hypothetical protein
MALLFCDRKDEKKRRTTMRPSRFDADPEPALTPTLDSPGPPASAAVHAVSADAGHDDDAEERTIEEPGYGHGV